MHLGEKIGRYTVRDRIGAGGMGEVYLAHDDRLRRDVAIKVLHSKAVNEPERLARFEQEAKAASALNHPNILTIYEFGQDDESHFLVTEFVAGRTLRDVMATGDLGFEKALKVIEQTAFALDAAHSCGIIHRDIKPDNLMIRDDGIVKVLDFGLAKLTENISAGEDDETRRLFQTAAGQIFGTAAYMSPEQVRGITNIDGRTDIWSLGVVTYELFGGRPPFHGSTSSDIIASILRTDPPALSNLAAGCPPELERICNKALKKDRDERYQHMRDLALDIRSLRKQIEFSEEYERSAGVVPVSGVVRGTASQRPGHTDRSKMRGSRVLIFVFAAALLAALGLSIYFGRASQRAVSTESVQTSEVASWASQPGEVYVSGSFSPDGKMVAFSSSKNGGKQIFVKQTSAGEAVQVTQGDAVSENPVWSPSGDEIAYFSNRGGKPGLWRIPILGGSPRLIAELQDGGAAIRSWLSSGQIYVEANSELYRVSSDGGQLEGVTSFKDSGLSARSITISRDGAKTAFAVTRERSWSLLAADEKGGTDKELLTGESEIRNIVWLPKGDGVVYSAQTGGRFQLFIVDISGGQPIQITNSERDCFALDVSADGGRILFGSAKEASDIWGVSDGKEFTVAAEVDAELWPDISPDGKTMAFQAAKELSLGNNLFNGRLTIKELGTDTQPTNIADGFLPVFSPNGERIAFLSVDGEKYDLNAVRTSGGEPIRLTNGGVWPPSYSVLPYLRVQGKEYDWSPDSGRIAFASRRGGLSNIWTVGLDGSGETRRTNNTDPKLYAYSPVWSADGKYIAFTTRDPGNGENGQQVYGIRVTGDDGTFREIYSADRFVRLLGWNSDGSYLYSAFPGQQETGRSFSDVEIGRISLLDGKYSSTATIKEAYSGNIFISKDRKFVVFSARRNGTDNIWTLPSNGGTERKVTNNSDPRLYFSTLAISPDGETIYYGKQSRFSLLSMATNFRL